MKCMPILTAFLMLSSAAFADISPEATPSSSAEHGKDDWTGYYLGVQSGSGNASLNNGQDRDDLGDLIGNGIHFGRLVDHGRLLAGAEVDAARIHRDADENRHKLLRFKTVFGVDLGKFAPYGVFGTAYFLPGSPELEPSPGLVYGLGANMKITDHLTLGIEYTKLGFNDFSGYAESDVDASLTQLRAAFRF